MVRGRERGCEDDDSGCERRQSRAGDSDDNLKGMQVQGAKGRESKSKRVKNWKCQCKMSKKKKTRHTGMDHAHRGMGVCCLKNHHVRSLMEVTPFTVYLA
jgi:hypothetical protein